MQTLILEAPAKVNLHLHVLAKRLDGFHDIETIFEKIDLCDEITLTKRKRGIRIYCRGNGVPQDKRNLAYQAAQALLAERGPGRGVEIRITKRIPVASGLGGASTDAASVLLGLNKLFSLGLTRSDLLEVANSLGADVPFFLLRASRAIGQGKGELLTPLKVKRKNWYVLVIPRLRVSTRKMYRALRITLTKRPYSVKIVLRVLEKGDLTSLRKYSYNSFERILQRKYKQVLEIKKALKSSGVSATFLSGSGPCVFGIAATRKEAIDITEKLRAKDKSWQVIVAKTGQMKPRI